MNVWWLGEVEEASPRFRLCTMWLQECALSSSMLWNVSLHFIQRWQGARACIDWICSCRPVWFGNFIAQTWQVRVSEYRYFISVWTRLKVVNKLFLKLSSLWSGSANFFSMKSLAASSFVSSSLILSSKPLFSLLTLSMRLLILSANPFITVFILSSVKSLSCLTHPWEILGD